MTRLPAPLTTRRSCLGWLALAALAGCADKAPSFRGIDVTGAGYGKALSLKDPDGRTRTLADFQGKAVLLFFGFTQCPDVCPTALLRAAEVRRLLGADGDRLQVLFVTLDPERDTPQVLREYTGAFDPGFLGLAGDLAETEQIAKEFRVYFKKVPTQSSYTIDHSAFTYLFDPAGQLRVLLKHEQTAQDYAADVRTVLSRA
ncbi:SCO family protein [Comamonas serinivorans]|uniref:SCO family protein n=1 Tax=Comamonas serinivorans TaxID=1082851 RepID=A0A1Y0EJ88_9BURK|nr:SCO family protein [Comamonas serinivorans]ARU03530.1 SCO family protein [Comamonas serinivorans]